MMISSKTKKYIKTSFFSTATNNMILRAYNDKDILYLFSFRFPFNSLFIV